MFVVRVLLGNAFICDQPQQWRRPPCISPGCLKDDCVDASHGGIYDSVIGTHRVDPSTGQQVALFFREFVVYEKAQCYPEYLVEYERQA